MEIKINDDNERIVHIVGSINESFGSVESKLKKILLDFGSSVKIDLSGVQEINSVGVSLWLNFLTELKVGTITLVRCSPVYVDYLNLVRSMSVRCKIDSVMVPYECGHCGYSWASELKIAVKIPDDFSTEMCQKCATKVMAEEEAEDYLLFAVAE